ncbi:MAG TPA: hypothetical protein VL860_11195 [Planctomycetota bacterium]|nr:hypothetical protein [Planctomycetota bacterium]
MAKMRLFCGLLMGLLVLSVLPTMGLWAEEADGGAVMPDDTAPTPAPVEPAPAPAPAASGIDTSTDQGKYDQGVAYESQGKINQALILFLQATGASDSQLAGMAAYHAGSLFMNNKSDNARAAKLFHFSFAVSKYSDSALKAGEAYRAIQQYALACKMFRWGAVDSNDPSVKTQCGQAFNETLPMFQQNAGGK